MVFVGLSSEVYFKNKARTTDKNEDKKEDKKSK
jgi:hypothetical protein